MPGVKVPTVRSVTNNLKDYGVANAAGVLFQILQGVTGSGLIGGAVASAASASILPGEQGRTISTILGFTSGLNLLQELGVGSPVSGESDSPLDVF